MKYLDLTRTICTDMQVCPLDTPPIVEDCFTIDNEGINVKIFKMCTHTSTHMDAPSHYFKDGETLDEVEPDRFFGTGVLLDFSDKGERYDIRPEDLFSKEAIIRSVDFAVFNTGWAKHYGQNIFFDHPFITKEAAELLVEWGVKLVATDGSSIDAAYGFSSAASKTANSFEEMLSKIESENVRNEAHQVFLSAGCLIVEYLVNLEKIDCEIAEYAFLPIKVKGADGSPVRAVCLSR